MNLKVGDKSRIEGMLTRELPADIVIRKVAEDTADDGLMRISLTVSSETPYLRQSWDDDPWIEVLGHEEGEAVLDRLNGGAPVMANHDRWYQAGQTPLSAIGKVERAWLDKGKLRADIVLSRRDALKDLRQDIADGLVKNVSIGYEINERTLTKRSGLKGQPNEYRVDKWTPFEISIVDIPADATVGIGRAHESGAAQYRVVPLTPAGDSNFTTEGKRIMTPETHTIPAENTLSAKDADDKIARAVIIERQRAKEIRAIGHQFDCQELAEHAIDNNDSLDAFRSMVLEHVKTNRTTPMRLSESPEIGMDTKEIKQYSFCKALLAASDPHNAMSIAPFEMEASRAAQDKNPAFRKDREGAITIPADVLNRGMQIDPANAAVALSFLASRSAYHDISYRDLVVGTPTAGGNLVATELLSGSFIELLRNSIVINKLGVTWLTNLQGDLAIPRQTGAATAFWVAENFAPDVSQQTVDQVTLKPKTVGGITDYSRRLLLQSSIGVEAFVRADIAAIIGLGIQQAIIDGPGGANTPRGLLNMTGIGAVSLGTNGGRPDYVSMIQLEKALNSANADIGNLGFLTNGEVRAILKATEEFAGCGRPVWQDTAQRGTGRVAGYNVEATNAVPRNLTKGTSTDCSAVIFGNWSDILVGMWGGLDIMLDPYHGAAAGTKRIIALQDVDVAVRHPESFAVIKDARDVAP